MHRETRARRILETIRDIPRGSVASYGQIAEIAGIPRGARQVGYVLRHSADGLEVPWHRVVRSSGRIAFAEDSPQYREQSALLKREDVRVIAGRVDMQQYRWQPDLDELLWKPSRWDDRGRVTGRHGRRSRGLRATLPQTLAHGMGNRNMTTVIFSHGQESGPWGTKIRAMAALAEELGCGVSSIDYRGIADPAERVTILVAECAELEDPLVLVGSSMGGHVATAAAARVAAAGLFVLAPAYYMPGYADLTPDAPALPTTIVHGWHDDVVPVDNSIRFARACSATLHVVDGDHRLTANIDEICVYLKQFLLRVMA